MSETKFTPGPWWPAASQLEVVDYNGGKGPFRLIAQASCSPIVDGTGSHTISRDEAVANANLIAAAPELFELATLALQWIDAVPQDAPLPAMPGFDRDWANQVIAKALGESK